MVAFSSHTTTYSSNSTVQSFSLLLDAIILRVLKSCSFPELHHVVWFSTILLQKKNYCSKNQSIDLRLLSQFRRSLHVFIVARANLPKQIGAMAHCVSSSLKKILVPWRRTGRFCKLIRSQSQFRPLHTVNMDMMLVVLEESSRRKRSKQSKICTDYYSLPRGICKARRTLLLQIPKRLLPRTGKYCSSSLA